jgi:hypothetical protein
MMALLVLLLIVAVFGGLGFVVHALWIVLALWVLGFLIGGAEAGMSAGRHR